MKTVIPTKCFHDLHVLIVDLVMINVAELMAFLETLIKYNFNCNTLQIQRKMTGKVL